MSQSGHKVRTANVCFQNVETDYLAPYVQLPKKKSKMYRNLHESHPNRPMVSRGTLPKVCQAPICLASEISGFSRGPSRSQSHPVKDLSNSPFASQTSTNQRVSTCRSTKSRDQHANEQRAHCLCGTVQFNLFPRPCTRGIVFL